MFKRSRIFLLTAVMLIVAAIIFAGCRSSQKPLPSQPSTPSPGTTGMTPGTNPGTGGQSLSTLQAPTTGSGVDTAKTISQQLTTINGVRRAAVVIDGTTAVVGVQFTDGTGKAATTSLQGNGTANAVPGTNTSMLTGNTGVNTGRPTGLPDTQTQINPIDPASPNPTTPNNAGITGQTGTNQSTTQNNANIRDIRGQERTSTGTGGNQATADVKTLVAQRVKAADSTITKVYVTTDMGMVDRLQRLSTTLSTDMKDITNKIQAGGGAR